jgi:hypothetical protein
VRVARLNLQTFTLAGVTGRLKDPPDVRWWERTG